MSGLLSHLVIIECSGPDSATFLQGQLTCDIKKLSAGKNSLAAHCNVQGKAVSLMRIICVDNNQFYLLFPNDIAQLAFDHLNKYAVFSQVNLINKSDTIHLFGSISNQLDYDGDLIISSTLADGRIISLCHASHTEHEDISCAWRKRDVQLGLPAVYLKSSELFIPQRLNLDTLGAISFKKGCYIGQEILSRLYFLGKVKYRMYLGVMSGHYNVTPGEVITNSTGKAIGHVVDGYHEENTYVLFEKLIDDTIEAFLNNQIIQLQQLPYEVEK